MYAQAKLLLLHYMPDVLKKGMWFMSIKQNSYNDHYYSVHELNHIPLDMDSYINNYGFPVLPVIYSMFNNNPDEPESILATPEQIGWYDKGDDSDELSNIDVNTINYILENYDGELAIEMENQEEVVLFQGLVTIRTTDNVPYGDDEDDDDEWIYDHPQDKTDYDPEDYDSE